MRMELRSVQWAIQPLESLLMANYVHAQPLASFVFLEQLRLAAVWADRDVAAVVDTPQESLFMSVCPCV